MQALLAFTLLQTSDVMSKLAIIYVVTFRDDVSKHNYKTKRTVLEVRWSDKEYYSFGSMRST